MGKELTEEEKALQVWIKSHFKDYGHSFGKGIYIALHTGEVFYNGTIEYQDWYDKKVKEYNSLK